ncbi:unnamed protein product, partial [Lampetra fluviatilis]
MSDILQRTLSSLAFLDAGGAVARGPGAGGANAGGAGGGLGGLVRALCAATSKQEEEAVVRRELASLKEQMASPLTTVRDLRECLSRAVYCETLGYSAPFAHIHSVNLAQRGSLAQRRSGYLAACLLLDEDHELMVMMVNTIIKDLQGGGVLELSMALGAVSQLATAQLAPTLLALVLEKTRHG